MRQKFIKINSDIRLSLYDFGGKGAPLIFCHFTGGLGLLWQITAELIKKDYHCFAYDARGHGDSSKPLDARLYDWNEHLSDLIYLVNYIKDITQSDIIYGVGHSFGGACLSQTVIHTQKILNWKKIILIEPIVGPDKFDFQRNNMSKVAEKRRGVFKSEKELENLRNKYPYKDWREDAWKIFVKHGFYTDNDGKYFLKCSPNIESFQYLYSNPHSWFSNLKKIKIPVLIMYGENSYLLPLGYPQIKQIPSSYLIKIHEASHFVPQEKPEIVANWIKKWFS